MSEYKNGSMDTTTQSETYDGFIRVTKKFVVAMIVLAVFLAIFRT